MLGGWFGKRKAQGPRDPLGHAHRVMQASIKVDFDFEAYASRHIFNRLSATSEYGFYYSPYGYFFRYPKWGTINELGFRCDVDLPQVRTKYPNHLVVALFGGSTGFDILVPDEQTFGQQLERLLNADAELMAVTGRRFKLVNLSQPGNTTLNQIVNYVLFCHRLQPDLVVSHNGANDIATAQMNDRNLIANYDFGYPDVLETWSRKLHGSDVELDYDFAEPALPDFRPASIRTGPQDVIRSYHARVLQFEALVRGQEAHFVSGFQPWVYSKRSPSGAEQARMRDYNPYYQGVYANAFDLCERYQEVLDRENHPWVVNLHRLFRDLPGDVTHFGDTCHLLEPGNRVVAEAYHRHIRALYLGDRP